MGSATKTDLLTVRGYIGCQPAEWRKGYEHFFVSITLQQPGGGNTTIHHGIVENYERLSITGETWRSRKRTDRDCESAGQILDSIQFRSFRAAEGITIGDVVRLREIWVRWHLNDLRPNCAHQRRVSPLPADLSTIPACPETGYRYGSAWLVEELPADVVAWVREFAAKLDQS